MRIEQALKETNFYDDESTVDNCERCGRLKKLYSRKEFYEYEEYQYWCCQCVKGLAEFNRGYIK